MWPGWGCQSARRFLIFYRLISELSKQVNWAGPSWELRFSQPGLPWAGSQRPSLKPEGSWTQASLHKQGSRCKTRRPGTPSERGPEMACGEGSDCTSVFSRGSCFEGEHRSSSAPSLEVGWGDADVRDR